MSAYALYDEAAKKYTGFDHHVFLSALIGSLSVLVEDEEIWRKAIHTAEGYMEGRRRETDKI